MIPTEILSKHRTREGKWVVISRAYVGEHKIEKVVVFISNYEPGDAWDVGRSLPFACVDEAAIICEAARRLCCD